MQMHSCRLQKLMVTGCKVNDILKTPTNFALVQNNKKIFCEENSSQLVHILQQLGDPWHHHLGPHHCVQGPGSWCGHLPAIVTDVVQNGAAGDIHKGKSVAYLKVFNKDECQCVFIIPKKRSITHLTLHSLLL